MTRTVTMYVTSLLLLAACAPAAAPTVASDSGGAAPTADWWSQAQEGIQADARAIQAVAGGYTAEAPRFGFSARFDAEGIRLHGATDPEDDLRLTLSAVGRGTRVEAVAPVAPELTSEAGEDDRVVYRRPGLTEWWRSLPAGLEQGFELDAAPAGNGPLSFVTTVDGADLVASDGEGVTFVDAAGRSWNIGGAAAWDADGVELPARLDARSGDVWLSVDDSGARYPITIDPVISSASATLTGGAANDDFGYSVARAGDVNGDGYADVIVGAYGTAASTGSAYVFHGGASGLSTWPATTLTGGAGGIQFGVAVAGVGDVNGDGYDDVAVGADEANGGLGSVAVYYGGGSGVSTSPASSYSGTVAGSGFGRTMAGGDLTGDGYSDLVLGAMYFGTNRGRFLTYLGSSSGLGAISVATVSGDADGATFGASLAVIGDATSDGYGDLLVGAPGYAAGSGRAYLFKGTPAGLTRPAFQYVYAVSPELLGSAVAGGGDINGDGQPDVIVGSPGWGGGQGAVYVFYGAGAGIDFSLATAWTGESAGDTFGGSVANAGDVDSDGYADVLASASAHNGATGRVYVHLGGSGGVDSSPDSTLDGLSVNDMFGASVAGLGDVNGDNSDDFIVGAYGVSAYSGAAYVYQGELDNDGDGYSTSQDCDDSNAAIHPDAVDVRGDGVDANCDGGEICYMDADDDNFRPDLASTIVSSDPDCTDPGEALRTDATGDCDDGDPSINPAVLEVPGDGIDENCDTVEFCYADLDDDGYLVNTTATIESTDLDCADAGEGTNTDPVGDCSDRLASVYPGAPETVGNNADESCDGQEICYVDADGDRYRPDDLTTVISADTDCTDVGEAAASSFSGDCNDADGAVNPRAGEVAGDQIDQNCDGLEICYVDMDDDGFRPNVVSTVASDDLDCVDPGEATSSEAVGDCDDNDAAVGPGGAEIAGDGLDQDCDGGDLCYVDADGDGYRTDATVRSADLDCLDRGEGEAAEPNTDCNDTATSVNPGAPELSDNGVDDNCDGLEACYADLDDDGYVPDRTTQVASADLDCSGPGEGQVTDDGGDCNEADPAINPGATEIVGDEIDQNCDGGETCYEDVDTDGYSAGGNVRVRSVDADCADAGEAPASVAGGDCNDTDAAINPAATEIVGDGIDENCDRAELCYADADNDGFRPDDGATVISTTDHDCLDRFEAGVADPTGDCNDADLDFYPGAEEKDCRDPNDYNCDGSVMYDNADGDAYPACQDCDDSNAAVNKDAAEVCNGIDDDCDGEVDPPRSADASTWYRDGDSDGYPAEGGPVQACEQPAGYSEATESFDCDDAHAGTNPGATDYPGDGLDQDCSGTADDPAPVDDTGVKDDYKACGCSTEGSGQGSSAAAVLLGIVGLSLARRRK